MRLPFSIRRRPEAVLPPIVTSELEEERAGHPALADEVHAREAVTWLTRAQDATPDGGFSRGFSLVYDPYFGGEGWQPSYPETTGYIIPTLFLAADELDMPELAERAVRAADWEIEIQLSSGAALAGVIGQGTDPAVFNTGQVLLGFLSAFLETDAGRYADAARRAGSFLTQSLGPDGMWTHGNSPYADRKATLYNSRVAWALAEAGSLFSDSAMLEAAGRNLRAVAARQRPNGWFPDCCLSDAKRPLLHTIAYTTRGLLEGGRVVQSSEALEAAERAASAIANLVRDDGFLAGRLRADWRPAVQWSCLTGQAQMANIYLRLSQITGDRRWLEPVDPMMGFLKRTQNRSSAEPGLRGGIKGAFPLDGRYGRFQVLNWATKFFLDALLRRRLDEGARALTHRHNLP